MDKVVKSFVTDKFPDFIVAEHEKFQLFVEAYYEWMELQNTEQTKKVTELYKTLPNPGALVANSDQLKDIDETVDGFVDYFRKSVIPVVIENSKTTDRFFIKKIRDVYLSKGTPKAFKLLFRLLFDEDVEIFETKNDVLKPSNSQYIQFSSMHFVVTEFIENLPLIDFTFSEIKVDTDSEDEYKGTVLSAGYVGADTTGRPIIKAQLAEDYAFNKNDTFLIFDQFNPNIFVRIRIIPTISDIEIIEAGSLYKTGDTVLLKSKALGTETFAIISKVALGTVEKLFVRDRGAAYGAGDFLSFKGASGSGGSAVITEADKGRVSKIDGIGVLTVNNVLANKFEGALVPVTNGGFWRSLPKVLVSTKPSSVGGLPYGGTSPGTGLSITSYSKSIGALEEIYFGEKPYFINDSEDILIETPLMVSVQRLDGIESGDTVAFQRFEPLGGAFNTSIGYDSDDSYDGVSNVGSWINTGVYGTVFSVRDDEGILSLKSVEGAKFVDSEGYVDIKTKNRKQLVKIARVDGNFNTFSEDDLNAPFKNVVSQISKATLKAVTVGVSNSDKAFSDERGFLNSSSGGVLQDNYFYSDFTYIIKTSVSMDLWKEKVRTMLHPAGTVMLSQLVLEQNASLPQFNAQSVGGKVSFSNFTFDTSLEHFNDYNPNLQITADNTLYTSAPFEVVDDTYPEGKEITADSFYETEFTTNNFERGDSWWDFEPLGLICDRTTQTQSSGIVSEGQKNYVRFGDSSKDARALNINTPMISSVKFEGIEFNKMYYTYDSDDFSRDSDRFACFSDSDVTYKQINYTSIEEPERQTRSAAVLRKKELKLLQEKDFRDAVNGTFVFNDPVHGLIRNIEGFEYKWNEINNRRTINTEGWGVVGMAPAIQNQSNNGRKDISQTVNMVYSTVKVPLEPSAYVNDWVITNSYNPNINMVNVVDLSASETNTTDPRTATATRRRT